MLWVVSLSGETLTYFLLNPRKHVLLKFTCTFFQRNILGMSSSKWLESCPDRNVSTHDTDDDVIKWKHFQRYWPFVSPPVTSGFPSQRPVTRSFDVFFDLRLHKRLSKQSRRRWFGRPLCPIWRHCDVVSANKPTPFSDSRIPSAREATSPWPVQYWPFQSFLCWDSRMSILPYSYAGLASHTP